MVLFWVFGVEKGLGQWRCSDPVVSVCCLCVCVHVEIGSVVAAATVPRVQACFVDRRLFHGP